MTLEAPKLDAELKAKWVAALRSGQYQQARGSIGSGDRLCCLGVLAVCVNGQEPSGHVVPLVWGRFLPADIQAKLVRMNDGEFSNLTYRGDKSFPEIADYVEAHL